MTSPETNRIDRGVGLRIACYSALILFFELALIRYTSGYVRVFGFYLNFVLIATFLGMGVGLLRARDAARTRWIAPASTLLLLGAVLLFSRLGVALPKDPDEFLWASFAGGASLRQVP